MNVLDLFSGIGGFSLGLERAGMRTVAFCETDAYCAGVLAKHWPNVPRFPDVRLLNAAELNRAGVERIDVICGGFPCQDISLAGKGAGLSGERSGLWFEYARLIEEIRPAWVIIENVSALRSRGLDAVLGSLAAIGYDAEWHCIPASAVGAPHRRDRVWIVAYPRREQLRQQPRGRGWASGSGASQPAEHGEELPVADADSDARNEGRAGDAEEGQGRRHADRSGERANVAYTHGPRLSLPGLTGEARSTDGSEGTAFDGARWWAVEPDVGRVADGVPKRVDRLRCLGNAVVPQIPEIIGRAIMRAAG